MLISGTALVTAGALALLSSAAVGAPSITVDRQCYTSGEPIHISGSGFTPAGGVSLLFNLDLGHDPLQLGATSTTALFSGTIDLTVRAPDADRRLQQQVALSAYDDRLDEQDDDQRATSAQTRFWISQRRVVARPWMRRRTPHGQPRRRVSFHAVGWEAAGGGTLYAHYLRGARLADHRLIGGTLVRTVRMGSLSGPCGDLTVTMREFPFRPVAAGDWAVDFSTTAAWPARRAPHSGFAHVHIRRSEAVR